MRTQKKKNRMKIRIHNTEWKVKLCKGEKLNKMMEQPTIGCTCFMKRIIYIKKGMDMPNTIQTVRHELAHAYLYEYGIHLDDEESICDFIGAFCEEIADMALSITGYLTDGNEK